MNNVDYASYFLCPEETTQRRYEVLRAVFVDEESMQVVAERFGLNSGTVRNWVCEFCQTRDSGKAPLFSQQNVEDVLR